MAGKAEVRKVHVRKGDLVEVRKGEDRGKRGKVLEVLPRKGRVVVEGVRVVKRHSRPSRTNPQGGVVESPAPLTAANVMLVCPSCNQPTRFGTDRSGEDVVRVCKNCGKTID
ncbi:50S ribosomal protein L24 [Limnochorda pilosa]|nr:50S ribosomal protein L24 [Limnochorda pilosa]